MESDGVGKKFSLESFSLRNIGENGNHAKKVSINKAKLRSKLQQFNQDENFKTHLEKQ